MCSTYINSFNLHTILWGRSLLLPLDRWGNRCIERLNNLLNFSQPGGGWYTTKTALLSLKSSQSSGVTELENIYVTGDSQEIKCHLCLWGAESTPGIPNSEFTLPRNSQHVCRARERRPECSLHLLLPWEVEGPWRHHVFGPCPVLISTCPRGTTGFPDDLCPAWGLP